MWEPLQRYRALDAEARKLFRGSVVLLAMIRVSLRSRGYQKTQYWLQQRSEQRVLATSSNLSAGQQVTLTCRMVRSAAHYGFIRPTCLEESLVLWYFLRGYGLAPKLRIGVHKADGKFEAHAWVEHEGETLNQSGEVHKHYAAFDREFPQPPAGRS
jgi:hypothetical protein